MGQLAQLPAEMLQAQISNGLVLLALGMGVVFFFLVLLIFTTKGMSAVVRKIESKNGKVPAKVASPAAQVSTSNDAQVAIAIAAALKQSKQ